MRIDAEADETESIARILRAVLSLGRRLRTECAEGAVSLAGIGVLSTLHRSGAMPAARLADAENLAPQSLTRLIAGLEAEGCIERRRSETDRRELVIAITPRGQETLGQDMQGRRAWLQRALAQALTGRERKDLLRATEAMLKLAQHQDARLPGAPADSAALDGKRRR